MSQSETAPGFTDFVIDPVLYWKLRTRIERLNRVKLEREQAVAKAQAELLDMLQEIAKTQPSLNPLGTFTGFDETCVLRQTDGVAGHI